MNDQNPKSQLVIKALGLGWSLVRQPADGHWEFLLSILPALLPAYLIRFSVWGIPTNLFEMCVMAAFVFGLSQKHVRRSWGQAFRTLPKPIFLFTLLFLASASVSTAISPHWETSAGILKGWIIIPIVFGWMIYALQIAGNSKEASAGPQILTPRALILSGLIVALLGLSQLGSVDRIRGPYDVPNSLALFLAPLTVLAFFWSLVRQPADGHWSFSRSAAVIMFVALLFTQSVAGVLSVFAVLGLSLCFRHWKLKPIWALCFGACVFLALPILLPKINYLLQPGSSTYVRLQLWSISWDLIKEHPMLGIGLGTFEPAYQQKLHERFITYEAARQFSGRSAAEPLREFVFRDPHNWVLSFWLNTGLVGLVSFVALHVYVFYWAFKHWSFIGSWSLGFGIFAALLVLLVFGLADTIYWKNDLAALHWLLLSFLALRFSR